MDSPASGDNVICVTTLLTRHQADQDVMAQIPVSSLLSGMRVLELGHFVAAPFATRLLADLGADVIKIEPPGGDPVREWGEQIDGHSLWWSMHGRNKRSVVVDLKMPTGRQAVLSIAKQCDAVVENYRPGGLAKLGLSDETLRSENPRLVIAHVSGYGQDGPYRDRAAFGVIGEAVGGLRYLTDRAESDGSPPVRVGISIEDSIAGIYAAFGVVAGLWSHDRGDGPGRTVDVALTEFDPPLRRPWHAPRKGRRMIAGRNQSGWSIRLIEGRILAPLHAAETTIFRPSKPISQSCA
jgi:crotonobetainyl-CoA:carnitine CoA-transferase CaiB-like acyl-CoA transferase